MDVIAALLNDKRPEHEILSAIEFRQKQGSLRKRVNVEAPPFGSAVKLGYLNAALAIAALGERYDEPIAGKKALTYVAEHFPDRYPHFLRELQKIESCRLLGVIAE